MRKNVSLPFSMITNGDMSGDLTSTNLNVKFLDNVGIQIVFTGVPVGTFYAECSIDGTNWQALDFGAPVGCSGAPGQHLLNINQCPFAFVRVFYDFTSGSGVLNVTAMAKEI